MNDPSYKQADVSMFHHSLEIIKVQNLKVLPQEEKATKKCEFSYNGREYKFFRVTDPKYFAINADIGNAYLIISIPADPFNGFYYKFVAAIYPV